MKGKDPAIEVTVTGVKPEQAPVGTEIVIIGSGLADVQRVTFGQVEAANLQRISATELRVTVPEGAVTDVITVHTPAGSAPSPRPFTVGELAGPATGEPDAPVAGEEERPPELDPEERLEAGLTGLTPEQIAALDEQAATELGEPRDAEVEDEPLDEDQDALVPDEDEDGTRP
jgi:hypothetical protein